MTQGQVPAFRSYDGPFSYTGPTGHEGRCYLHVFERWGALPVVVYEVASNHGPSVTNAAASIATQVWWQLLPDAKEGIIVVVYVDPFLTNNESPERFADVVFHLDGNRLHSPKWKLISRATIEAMIGGPLTIPVESS